MPSHFEVFQSDVVLAASVSAIRGTLHRRHECWAAIRVIRQYHDPSEVGLDE